MTKQTFGQPAGGELKEALQALRNAFTTVGAFSGFINLMMLAPALYMLQVYDRVLGSRNETTLVMLTVLVVGALLFMAALESVRGWILVRVGARLDAQLNGRVFTAAFERNLQQAGSNTAQPIHDLNAVRQTLTGSALLAAFDAPWLPIYLVVIFMMSPLLGWFALAGAIVLLVLAVANERISKPRLDEAQKFSMQSHQALVSHLRNSEVIEAMGMLPAIRQRWHALHRQQIHAQALASDRAAMLSGATKFVRIAMQSLILGFGALLVLEDQITAGMMIAASILLGRAFAPIELLVGNWKQIVSGRQAYARLQELLQRHPARGTSMSLPRPQGRITAEGVSAMPPGTRRMVLKNLGFTIAPGEVVAVVGPSASGKSSLARLLVGVWAPAAGSLRLDGASVYDWNKDELGPALGYLPQDIELFDGTVAENIARFGEVDSERVVDAARKVGMHEHILHLPQGYDTPLGAEGSNLSAGQRQRIGLARALYGDPALIVLDEPNSNLDEAGEKALLEALLGLKARGATVVIVTHRMSTLAAADKVMVLTDGTLAAFGPRDEVFKPTPATTTAPSTPNATPANRRVANVVPGAPVLAPGAAPGR
ncbi:MAG TPA: type I secretion system permease/ATPase [Thauera sp.]|uniref:type I secretion system permease/ATPase n=1 Tax=Thauera sp. TaxID=1905334 RepID=UPI000F9043A8|nr:type I secretion system permease/ATPase [Thauera sp.]MCB1944976.1 type I secretion system permease/ATPase [Thauera sp.]MCP5224788.1 type I secretion system permease/ATPase [Thauera sp.]RTL18755.1 MAG: type I secretion system permease/ATPase [Rhodocyclaceae bacterium]HRV76697.1 type I secretion system permease/ATPase [Thauera sp.]